MSETDWEKLLAIRKEMNANLMAVGPRALEKYVELFVKSLGSKGDKPLGTGNRTAEGGLPPLPRGRNAL